MVPRTVMCSVYASGAWSSMPLLPQTTAPKFFLTSAYSVPDPLTVCWQWTENATLPIEVIFDGTMIPELSDLALPIAAVALTLMAFVRISGRRKGKEVSRRGARASSR